MAEVSPWADLIEDLLDQIFGYLPSFADRACCTGVCRRWQVCAMQQKHEAPPMLPWLLRPCTAGASYFRIFSRTTIEKPAVPENARSAPFLGSSPDGWFVIARGQWRGYAMLELITGDVIPLPDGLQDEIPDELRVGIEPSALLILAATFSHPLTPAHGYFIAGIALGHHKFVICRHGMDSWLPLEPLDPNSETWKMVLLEEYEDVIHCNWHGHGRLFFLTSQERLLEFEIDHGDEIGDLEYVDFTFYTFHGHCMLPPPKAGHSVAGRYPVQSGRNLFMVKRFSSPVRGTRSFQVFRLRWRNGEPRW